MAVTPAGGGYKSTPPTVSIIGLVNASLGSTVTKAAGSILFEDPEWDAVRPDALVDADECEAGEHPTNRGMPTANSMHDRAESTRHRLPETGRRSQVVAEELRSIIGGPNVERLRTCRLRASPSIAICLIDTREVDRGQVVPHIRRVLNLYSAPPTGVTDATWHVTRQILVLAKELLGISRPAIRQIRLRDRNDAGSPHVAIVSGSRVLLPILLDVPRIHNATKLSV